MISNEFLENIAKENVKNSISQLPNWSFPPPPIPPPPPPPPPFIPQTHKASHVPRPWYTFPATKAKSVFFPVSIIRMVSVEYLAGLRLLVVGGPVVVRLTSPVFYTQFTTANLAVYSESLKDRSVEHVTWYSIPKGDIWSTSTTSRSWSEQLELLNQFETLWHRTIAYDGIWTFTRTCRYLKLQSLE